MLWTTVPSIIIALLAFFVLGLGSSANVVVEDIVLLQNDLAASFLISPLMLGPLLLLLYLALKKLPALSTLVLGTLTGCLFAVVFQWDVIIALSDNQSLVPAAAIFKGLFHAMFLGYSSVTGNVDLDQLLSKGGMASMLTTVGLIINAMAFGGAMSHTGLLERLVEGALRRVKSAGGLITATVGTCIGTNVLAADQYLSIAIPGQMFVNSYKKYNLSPLNLSRTLEDSGTLTGALIPWNTCGAYMSATLGVSTMVYAPYAFFNLLCPIIAIFYGYWRIALPAADPEDASTAH